MPNDAGTGMVSTAEARPAKLLRASHWQIEDAFAPESGSALGRAAMLARCLGAQARSVMAGIDPAGVTCVLSSTHLSSVLGGLQAETAAFLDDYAALAGVRPRSIVNAYECTGWGYVLQHLAAFTPARRVLLTIVDMELHGFRFWDFHHAIGRSGWGAITLLVELPEAPLAVTTDGPFAASAFAEFVRALRGIAADRSVERIFTPFFKPDLFRIASGAVGADRLGTNFHAEYGHAFGSDPWLGVIRHIEAEPPVVPRKVAIGSVAYSGYYAVAQLEIGPDTRTRRTRSGGDEAALERMIDDYPELSRMECAA